MATAQLTATKRGRTPKPPLEKEIQKEICEWLRIKGYFFWRSNNIPVFSTSNDGVRRFRALPKDTPRGLPDIMLVHMGKFVGIEVKRPGFKLRPEQAEFALKLLKNEAVYMTVHSLEELKAGMIKAELYEAGNT